MNDINEFINTLYSKLLATCPVDTRNMVTHIFPYDYGAYKEIRIEVDYAKAVNYNRQRTPKEAFNFHWVERAIQEASEIHGANVEWGIY